MFTRESPPPKLVGELTPGVIESKLGTYTGALRFIVSGETGIARPVDEARPSDRRTTERYLGALEPFWRPVDEDFRSDPALDASGQDTSHTLVVRDNAPFERFMNGFGIPALQNRNYRQGMVHTDVRGTRSPLYNYHTSSSTGFYIGHRWFTLTGEQPNNTPTGWSSVSAGLHRLLLEPPLAYLQAAHAAYFQPPAGSIVRIDGQFHHRPNRAGGKDTQYPEKYISASVRTVKP